MRLRLFVPAILAALALAGPAAGKAPPKGAEAAIGKPRPPAAAEGARAGAGATSAIVRPSGPPLPPVPAARPSAAAPAALAPSVIPPQPGLLAGVAAWAGCPPHCAAAAGRAGMRLRSNFVLHFPPLRSELERMLGRRGLAELMRLADLGPPVERRDGWVRVALCREGHCATEFLVLFVHPEAGEMVLCWHEERWVPHQLRWGDNRGGVWRTGAAGRQPLPPEGCNNRGALHGHDWDLLRRLADG